MFSEQLSQDRGVTLQFVNTNSLTYNKQFRCWDSNKIAFYKYIASVFHFADYPWSIDVISYLSHDITALRAAKMKWAYINVSGWLDLASCHAFTGHRRQTVVFCLVFTVMSSGSPWKGIGLNIRAALENGLGPMVCISKWTSILCWFSTSI